MEAQNWQLWDAYGGTNSIDDELLKKLKQRDLTPLYTCVGMKDVTNKQTTNGEFIGLCFPEAYQWQKAIPITWRPLIKKYPHVMEKASWPWRKNFQSWQYRGFCTACTSSCTCRSDKGHRPLREPQKNQDVITPDFARVPARFSPKPSRWSSTWPKRDWSRRNIEA